MTQKVLLFTTGGCGGSERVTLIISQLLHKNSYNVKNIVLELDSKQELYPFIPSAIPCEHIKIKRLRNSIFTLYKVIKREKPNFVFSSVSLIGIMLIILSPLFRGIKVIIRQGFMPISGLDGTPILIKIFYRYAYKLIAQTIQMKESMSDYYQLDKKFITVIRNPIDKEYINKKRGMGSPFTGSNEIRYVAVGRLGVFKDYETLIKAFEIVIAKNGNAHLYILGADYDMEYSCYIKNLVKEKKISHAVHFEGFSDNPYRYLFNSDCFVLSSISEGLPNVMLEAMYLRIPVVATKCIPFIEENIIEGVNGYSVNVKNYIDLAAAMEKAINLKDRIAENKVESDDHKLVEVFK